MAPFLKVDMSVLSTTISSYPKLVLHPIVKSFIHNGDIQIIINKLQRLCVQ